LKTRDFFKDPLTREEILEIAALVPVEQMFSWNSPSAKPYRARKGRLSEARMIDLMLKEPRLMRRPIFIKDGKVVIGFRKEDYGQLPG